MRTAAGVVASAATPEDTLMEALYHEHAGALWRYALRLTGDRGRAEDVVQETLLRAWQHPEITGDSVRAWLVTVARNLVIDHSRSARARYETGSLDVAPEPAGPDGVDATLDRMLVADAVARLSADHRAVLCRAYYQGWGTARIAADLGIAEGTAKSRLHYAMRALRLALQELGVSR